MKVHYLQILSKITDWRRHFQTQLTREDGQRDKVTGLKRSHKTKRKKIHDFFSPKLTKVTFDMSKACKTKNQKFGQTKKLVLGKKRLNSTIFRHRA